MIEVTDEMINQFRGVLADGGGYRGALAAVLAIVERDWNMQPNPNARRRALLGPDDQGDCEACDHLAVSHRDDGCHAELRTSSGVRPCPCLLARWQVPTVTGS